METMSDLLEEITWQGEFNGQKIVMTAHHVIWLSKPSDCYTAEELREGVSGGTFKPSAREIYEKLDTRWLDGDMISLDEQDKLTKRDIQAIASYGEERYQQGLKDGKHG
jgi:hypothetical protein